MTSVANPVVHLELHTGDLPGARGAYARLCGWRSEQVESHGRPYLAVELGDGFGGGIVQSSNCIRDQLSELDVVLVAALGDQELVERGIDRFWLVDHQHDLGLA